MFVSKDQLPRQIGPYLVDREIGRGAFAQVLRGRRVDGVGGGRQVAIKLVSRGNDKDALRRLRTIANEVRIGYDLRHPNIAKLYDLTFSDDLVYFVMELLEGMTLEQVLRWARKKRFRLDPGIAVLIGAEILDALYYAHSFSDREKRTPIIHRDLKPANLMLTWEGDVKLMDFGIARSDLSQIRGKKNTTAGTPAYMAPEQVRGRPPEARQDLFSFGSMLYEMVTGRRLFGDPDLNTVLRRVARGDVEEKLERAVTRRPALEAMVGFLRRLLAVNPDGRPQDAQAARDELLGLQVHYPSPVELGRWMSYIKTAQEESSSEDDSTPEYTSSDDISDSGALGLLMEAMPGHTSGELDGPLLSGNFAGEASGLIYTAGHEEAVTFLDTRTPFTGCGRDVLGYLVENLEPVSLSDGDILFELGDENRDWFVVRQGVLRVLSKDGVAIARLGPGEMLGEMAMLTGSSRSATVVSEGSSLLFKMTPHRFERLKARRPQRAYVLVRRLTERMCTRLRAVNHRLTECSADAMRFLQDPEVSSGRGEVDPSLRGPAGLRRLMAFLYAEDELVPDPNVLVSGSVSMSGPLPATSSRSGEGGK